MPGYLLIKGLDSTYLSGNLIAAREYGFNDPDDLYGLSDLTVPHKMADIGQFFINLDTELIHSGESLNGLTAFPFHGNIQPFYLRKSILKDKNNHHVGIYSHAEVCSDVILQKILKDLIETHPTENFNNQRPTSNCFIFNKYYHDLQLTMPESSCLFYLIRHKTKADITRLLHSSTLIIDAYIEKIKSQLNVNTISDIIELSSERNYANIVPPGIFNQLYSIHGGSAYLKHANPQNETIRHSSTHQTISLSNQQLKSTIDKLTEANLQFEPVNVIQLINHCVDIQRQYTLQQIHIHTTFTNNLPDIHVDLYRIKQIISALLFDAIDNTPNGGNIQIKCSHMSGENQLYIHIIDSGFGLSRDYKNRLKQKLSQTETTSQFELESRALQRLIALHQGELRVEHTLGTGTQTTLILPYQRRVESSTPHLYLVK